jgi:hypothetical protein
MLIAGELEFTGMFPNVEWDYFWITADRGEFVRKLNTHSVYILGQRINALTILQHKDGLTLRDIFIHLFRADMSLKAQVKGDFFSTSLKRSAGAVLRPIHDLGIDADNFENAKLDTVVQSFEIQILVQKAKEFETVLSNELPGLATYVVSPKGIFSTDDLIANAEQHIPEKYRPYLSTKACNDIQQAGKCLAFELPTASAFHIWRAVESVMDSYHKALTRKSFADAGITRNWSAYVQTLIQAKAETKITTFLDHIREEYRNPISHPDEMLELDEAFALFGPALSVIGQMLKEVSIKQPLPSPLSSTLGGFLSPPKVPTTP